MTSRSLAVCLIVLLSGPCIDKTLAFVIQRSHRITVKLAADVESVEGPFDVSLMQDFWGRRPLLIRQAFDSTDLMNQEIWPSWENIVELACHQDNDEEIYTGESARIIQHVPNQLESYTLELGPFDKTHVQQVGNDGRKWTLLVNDVDRYMPELSYWVDEEFGFLPRWRRDDAQVSIAPQDGGIGPHVDNYDVFLVQASGSRSWLVGHDKMNAAAERQALVPDISVSILRGDFECSEFRLDAGDVLYLPPRVVHWGTAVSNDCMTISVGCRAPSAAEITSRVAETMLELLSEPVVKRYTDEDLLKEERSRGPSLKQDVKDSMKTLVLGAVRDVLNDDVAFDEIVGKLVTESKRLPYGALHPWDEVDDDEYFEAWGETLDGLLDRVLSGNGALYRAEGISFATSQVTQDGKIIDRLYACGEMFEVKDDPMAASVFARIEQGHALNSKSLSNLTSKVREVLDRLVAEGFLDASYDSEEER